MPDFSGNAIFFLEGANAEALIPFANSGGRCFSWGKMKGPPISAWLAFACRCLLSLPPLLPAGALGAAAPLKGLALWPDEARARPGLSREISLEFAYVRPCDLVAGLAPDGGGIFDWGPLDRLLDDIASRGHQAILRFRYEYPGEMLGGVRGATAVPAPVKALPGYRETFSRNPNGDGPTWYADWSHPGLREFTLRFFDAFAERYDADPRLAFLEAGFGHWGEWHVAGTPLRLGVNFPGPGYQAAFLRRLASLFRYTPWLVSIDAAESVRSPAASDPGLAALPFGLFDDSFMHRHHDTAQGGGYNERCWRAFGTDRWQRAPAGGEISYFEKDDQLRFLSPRGIHGTTFAEAAAKYHITFMVANDAPAGPHATPRRFREASWACGYRFRLVSAEADGNLLRVRIANDGVAPLYHDAHPAFGDAVAADTLRGLLPGETRDFGIPLPGPLPADPAPGIRLVSPKLLPGMSLPLGREGGGRE